MKGNNNKKNNKNNKGITSEEALQQKGLAKAVSPVATYSKAPEQLDNPTLVVNNIQMRSVDRTPKDVGNLVNAQRNAENIYFPNRTQMYDIFYRIINDGHLSGVWTRRVSAAVNKKYVFVDADNKPVDEINDLMQSSEFINMLKALMEKITWSQCGLEFIPGDKFCYKKIPIKHIKPELKVIAINQTDYDGIPYENIDNIWVVGEDRDLGLLLKCAFYVLLKTGSFSDWASYIEIFGQPMMVTKYDMWDEKTKAQVTQMMQDAGASLRLSMPKQADFEIIDGKTSNGNGDLQDKFKNACNDELSLLVLTVTETTKSSKSSGYAQSETQSDQQFEITIDDVKYLLALLNTDKFKNILKSYNYKTDGGKFIVETQMKVAEQKLRVDILSVLKNDMMLPMDDDDLYEEFGVKKPQNYNALKTEMQNNKQQVPPKEDDADAIPPAPGAPTNPTPPAGGKPTKQKAQPAKLDNEEAEMRNKIGGGFKFIRSAIDFFRFARKR